MKTLSASLGRMFKPAHVRKADMQRKAREEAKRLAIAHGVEIESFKGEGGMNVWPPKAYRLQDPWEGDHYAQDWSEALYMVRTYAGLEQGPSEASQIDQQ